MWPRQAPWSLGTVKPARVFTIQINNDVIAEADETFKVRLFNGLESGFDRFRPAEEIITIQDSSTVPVLSTSNVSANEGAGKAVVTVNLSAATGRAVSVSFFEQRCAGSQNCNIY
jgi:hypothetical protein